MTTQESVKKFQLHARDSGSPEVQVALLTTRIDELQSHFEKHKLDYHSKRGLMKMVARRRKLLKYLQDSNFDRYKKLIDSLDLRK